MFRKGRRSLKAAVLAALLAVPLTAEAAGGVAGREPMDLWSRLSGWLWAQAESVSVFWAADEGPKIDPNGQPTSSDQTDEGPMIDPNGRPNNSAQGDLGPYVDPSG